MSRQKQKDGPYPVRPSNQAESGNGSGYAPLLAEYPPKDALGKAISSIRSFLVSKACAGGHILIHRTNEPAFQSIMASGLRTTVREDGCLDYSVTVHEGIGSRNFETLLQLRHRGSTHHIILFFPQHAIDDFARLAEAKGDEVRATPDMAAIAIGGILPIEWIAGVYIPGDKAFIPNQSFDPAHRAHFIGP